MVHCLPYLLKMVCGDGGAWGEIDGEWSRYEEPAHEDDSILTQLNSSLYAGLLSVLFAF